MKELSDYLEKLTAVGDIAVEAVKTQIDIEADRTESEIRKNTPTDTGGLAESLTRTKVDRAGRYGHRLEYEGNAPDGTPYAKIANILNHGTSTIKPRRFIAKAVRKLKGLDDRAAARFEEQANKLLED